MCKAKKRSEVKGVTWDMPVTTHETYDAQCWHCGGTLTRAESRDRPFGCMELMVLAMAVAGWGFHAGMIACAKCLIREGGMKLQLLQCGREPTTSGDKGKGGRVKSARPGGAGDQPSVDSERHPDAAGQGDGENLVSGQGAG